MALMPTLFVDDVEASSRWYQTLLGAQSMHGGPDFEMLSRDGAMVLQLHRAEADEHGDHRLPAGAPRGAGVLLYCEVADVRAMHRTATEWARSWRAIRRSSQPPATRSSSCTIPTATRSPASNAATSE